MRTPARALAVWLICAAPLAAAGAKDCLDLSASRDNDVSSPSGVQVSVTGYNRCDESIHPSSSWFRVTAIGSGNVELGARSGRFQATITPRSRGETKIFVPCDGDRVRLLRVQAE